MVICVSPPVWFSYTTAIHDDVIKSKHLPRYWPFVRGIHQSPVNSPHKGQWREDLKFSLICVWINGWVNNRKIGFETLSRPLWPHCNEWQVFSYCNSEGNIQNVKLKICLKALPKITWPGIIYEHIMVTNIIEGHSYPLNTVGGETRALHNSNNYITAILLGIQNLCVSGSAITSLIWFYP